MESYEDNPGTNILAAGVTEEKLNAAIIKSGYPLQTKVAMQLQKAFPVQRRLDFPIHIQEEWSFVDDRTGEIRTIDLLAEKLLFDITEEPRVRPVLTLIIECKQSELPFVFFLSDEKPIVRNFPYLAGLSEDKIVIKTDNDISRWHLTVQQVLSLEKDHFVVQDPIFCNKFSKCERRSGGDLLLSGEESFHGIVYPLLKAMHHFKLAEKPPTTARYFDCHLVLGIGILDAPMVGVRIINDGHETVLLPWVRVVRHQADKVPDFLHSENIFAIDIIHKAFLDTYIRKHVSPFSERVSKLILKHQRVLATGKGFVPNMGGEQFPDIENNLLPRLALFRKK